MPGQKRKYNVRFPPGRIKKIMQKDMEVGRIATAVPVIISRALEIFLKSFLTKTSQITQSKHSRVMSIGHMKECIEAETLFDFLKNLVEQASVPSPLRAGRVKGKWSGHSNRKEPRRRWPHFSGKAKQHEPADRSRRPHDEPLDNPEHLNVGRGLRTVHLPGRKVTVPD